MYKIKNGGSMAKYVQVKKNEIRLKTVSNITYI